MKFEESHLDDFDGLLLVDSSSNIMLNLTFFNARGSLIGHVHGYNSSQAIQTLLPSAANKSSEQRLTRIIRLGEAVTCISPKNQVRVALHPYGHKAAEVSRMIPCLENGLRKFRNVDSSQVPTQVLTQQSQLSGWAYWSNPLNWVADSTGFSLTSSTSGIVILVISCVVGVCTLVCIIKCCFCIGNPCCCK